MMPKTDVAQYMGHIEKWYTTYSNGYAILISTCDGRREQENILFTEKEDVVGTTQWSRDWESFSKSYVGKNEAEELTNDELIEYLRWMACNKSARYAKVMTAFANTQRRTAV